MLAHRGQVHHLPQARPPLALLREELKQSEVAHDVVSGAGPLHLDDDLRPSGQRGPMDLGDGACCQRLRIDGGEHVFPRHSQGLLHDLDDLGLGDGRDVVLEFREFLDEHRGHQVRARREYLPELAERGPQFFERFAQSPGLRALCGFRVGPIAREQLLDAMTGHHRTDLGRPPQQLGRGLLAHFDADAGRSGNRFGIVVQQGRIDDDDRAARVVRDAVRHVPQQEPGALLHPGVADDQGVDVFFFHRAQDRAGRIVVDQDARFPAGSGEFVRLRAKFVRERRGPGGLSLARLGSPGVEGKHDLDEQEGGAVQVRERGRPANRPLRRRRSVGGHGDAPHIGPLFLVLFHGR